MKTDRELMRGGLNLCDFITLITLRVKSLAAELWAAQSHLQSFTGQDVETIKRTMRGQKYLSEMS